MAQNFCRQHEIMYARFLEIMRAYLCMCVCVQFVVSLNRVYVCYRRGQSAREWDKYMALFLVSFSYFWLTDWLEIAFSLSLSLQSFCFSILYHLPILSHLRCISFHSLILSDLLSLFNPSKNAISNILNVKVNGGI